MSKIHILSNRLPFSIQKNEDDFTLSPSVGGLATGMKSVYKEYGGSWIGWSGLASDTLNDSDAAKVDEAFQAENCKVVSLSNQEINLYYEGFSNKTIWPLFHYFTEHVEYDDEMWQAYVLVNQKFADAALEVVQAGDTLWVHDYQLLLVPQMVKEKMPQVTIGFFLHIPFPSFEVFRVLPWRKELIAGVLGADLIGFHTYDYERHFFSSVRRLLGYDISFNKINLENRVVMADVFPMGIDYERFNLAAQSVFKQSKDGQDHFKSEPEHFYLDSENRKWILSIDRLDYTKGIPNRLRAFDAFLQKYPEQIGKVTLVMLAVPSRDEVDQYIKLKSTVDELVGQINGKYGGMSYSPIWYFYRSLPFENLIELYTSCDVALITPIRDGMNLVAKEYVASRVNGDGVIVLSEMAGVAKEMGEAIIINPNNQGEIADAIQQALSMPVEEQKERMEIMQKRIKRYDVFKWAGEFVHALEKVKEVQSLFVAKKISASVEEIIVNDYRLAKKRAIFLDYDGTLTSFRNNPQSAFPDKALHGIINQLTADPKNDVTIISGRDRATLEKWFDGHKVNLIVEHGVWSKRINHDWEQIAPVNVDWKANIRPTLESFVDRTPGSFIEEKNYSLVWHYRKAELEQGALRANDLKDELMNMIANRNLEIMEGNKVIEVKNGGINKGAAALRFLAWQTPDFIMAIGDDWTDEYMFNELPDTTVTIKVGLVNTAARYKLESVDRVREFLGRLGAVE
jgi:trehalose 6-phosphate synthase/phosphatase